MTREGLMKRSYERNFVIPESVGPGVRGSHMRAIRGTDPVTGREHSVPSWENLAVQRPFSSGIPAYLVTRSRNRLVNYPGIKTHESLAFDRLRNPQRVYPNRPGPNDMQKASYIRFMKPWLAR